MEHSKRILRKTWQELYEELKGYLEENRPLDMDFWLFKHEVEWQDLIYADIFPSFFEYLVYGYGAGNQFQKAVLLVDYLSTFDGFRLFTTIDLYRFERRNSELKDISTIQQKLLDEPTWTEMRMKAEAFRLNYLAESPLEYYEGGPFGNNHQFDKLLNYPLKYIEKKVNTANRKKCVITNRKLEKGEEIYVVKWFLYHSFSRIDKKAAISLSCGDNPAMKENLKKYENNSYHLNDLLLWAFDTPWMNQLVSGNHVSAETMLDLIVYGYQAPMPYEWVDLYVFIPNNQREHSPEYVYQGNGAEYIKLLWILLKSGYEQELIEAINRMPLSYALTLLIFDYPSFHQQVLKEIHLDGLFEVYEILRKRSCSFADIKKLALFGKAHPEFLTALSESLQRHEYHLYTAFDHTPHMGDLQWLTYLTGKHGSRFFYLFIYAPEKLPILRQSLDKQALPSGLAYYEADSIYETILYYLILNNHEEDYSYWKNIKRAVLVSQLTRIHKNAKKLEAKKW